MSTVFGSGGLRRIVGFRPVAVVVALLAVLFTAGETGERPVSVIHSMVDSQHVRLSMPATDHPRGIAVFFHGQTGGDDNRMDDTWLQSLVSDGWIVAASDFHTASWGDPQSTQDTENLIAWARKETGQPVRMFVSGSMGSSVLLNALTHGVPAPACVYAVKPAVDLTKMTHVPGAQRLIQAVYGDTVPTDRNPVDNLGKLPTSTRYRLVASYGDTWIVRKQNADVLSAALKARGADVSTLTATGAHEDPSEFNNADLDKFAAGC